jgi:hypothetical protein
MCARLVEPLRRTTLEPFVDTEKERAVLEIVKWAASISGMVAALAVAADLGRRITGWGFVLFLASSAAWITAGLLDEEPALSTQNAVLFVINCVGVYRYLIRKMPSGGVSATAPGARALPPKANG